MQFRFSGSDSRCTGPSLLSGRHDAVIFVAELDQQGRLEGFPSHMIALLRLDEILFEAPLHLADHGVDLHAITRVRIRTSNLDRSFHDATEQKLSFSAKADSGS